MPRRTNIQHRMKRFSLLIFCTSLFFLACSPAIPVSPPTLAPPVTPGSPAALLTHGPISGAVISDSAAIWGRTSESAQVEVEYRPVPNFAKSPFSSALQTNPADDFTFQLPLTRSLSDTTVLCEHLGKWRQNHDSGQGLGRALQNISTRKQARACSRWSSSPTLAISTPRPIRGSLDRSTLLPRQMRRIPILFLSAVISTIVTPTSRRRNAKCFRTCTRTTPNLPFTILQNISCTATPWHTSGTITTLARTIRIGRQCSRKIPSRCLRNISRAIPGQIRHLPILPVWQRCRLFVLDNRYDRDPNQMPDGPTKSMLDGDHHPDGQTQWLLDGLKNSTAAWSSSCPPPRLTTPLAKPIPGRTFR